MKFTCNKDILLNAVNSAIKAVSNKTSLPALECFHIIVDDLVTIEAHDLATGIKCTFEADIMEKGSYLINAKLFSDILRKLPNDEILLSVNENLNIQISCDKSIFDLTVLDDREFPAFPSITKQSNFTINSDVLKEMINQTKFAKSDNESKLIHTGFLFEIENNVLTMVTVDGYRLALRREAIISSSEDKFSFVVPGNALIELEKILTEGQEITIYIDRNNILFEIDNIILTTRLIDGDFLDYKKSIPTNFNTNINCNTTKLRQTIDRVSLLISEKTRVPIRFKFENNVIKISCITTIGKSYDEFSFDGVSEDFEIGFNNKYLIDALSACPDETATFSFKGSLSPLVITPDDGKENFVYLILPVRIKTND